jgi:cytochrome c oxidase cbb3-type subunit 3
MPTIEAIAAVPLGDLAGAAESTLATSIANPFGSNPQAAQQGHELFIRMNCAGCHGYGAKGGMGPNLTDAYWRYGGTPVALFKSIYEGRPQGMPAWNPTLPPAEIWKLVAYIQSLGGTFTAAQYQASVQGDRVGDNVAPEVNSTLADKAGVGGPKGPTSSDSPPTVPPRPDAGGPPPGSKP